MPETEVISKSLQEDQKVLREIVVVLRDQVQALQAQVQALQRGFINLRALIKTSNVRGATREILKQLVPLKPPVHKCNYPDCDGAGRTYRGEILPCYVPWKEEWAVYNARKKMEQPVSKSKYRGRKY
jgi:hypothetical protein